MTQPLNLRRVRGVYKRFLLELWHNKSELFEIIAWALLDLLAWGLLASFIERGEVDLPLPIAFLIGSALLWNIMFRVQIGSAFGFLYDAWSGNTLAMFASPVTPVEYFSASILFSLTVGLLQLSIMAVIAQIGFGFSLASLGVGLVPFFGVLIVFGIALSMVVLGLILRFGHGANMLAWTLSGLLQPLSAVYFPVAILPNWGQALSQILPTTHAFEAMRAVLTTGTVPWDRLWVGLVLDLAYVAAGAWFAARMLTTMRARGMATRYAY